MPMIVNGQTFYRTSEACQMVGISRSTLLRWVKEGSLDIREYRDRRKWRLFTEQEIDKLSLEANRVSVDR